MADIDPDDPEFNDQLKLKIRQKFINKVGPLKVVDHLKQVLTDDDVKHIKSCTRNDGNLVGAEELLSRLTQYKGWFACLMSALRQVLPEVATKLAGDYDQLMEHLCAARSNEVHLREGKGCTSLPDAASRGHIGCIIDLIFSGEVDLNSKNERGETAVYLAAEGGHIDCLEILIQAGCDVNIVNKDRDSPVYVATNNGFSQCVEALIEAKAFLQRSHNYGFTETWAAAVRGHVECLQLLLKAGTSADNWLTYRPDGLTPLMAAAMAGEEKCVQMLINAGANITLKDCYGRSPLLIAAMEWKPKCLRILIDAGADINTPAKSGETPLIVAAGYRHFEIVTELLSAGADIHRTTDKGQTALMAAASNGDEESLQALIDAGSNINAQDSDGKTALILAAVDQFDVCGQILVENGADIHLRDKSGRTAVHYVAHKHCLLLTILIDLGADVNARDNIGETPLMIAARDYDVIAVDYLIGKGADADKVSCQGYTAWMFAESVMPGGPCSKLIENPERTELSLEQTVKLLAAVDFQGKVSCSDVQAVDVLNRSVEVEHCSGPEDTLQQYYSDCQKNPGHMGFIPITEFGLSHLPYKYRDQRIVDVIKAEAELTVRLLVKYTSTARPDGYNAFNMRGKKGRRVGSGWIASIVAKFTTEDNKKCPCSDCEASGDAKTEWGVLRIKTAMHVVFDSSEAKQTLVHIFADVDKPEDMHKLYGYEVYECNQNEDFCYMHVVTHDLRLWNYLESMNSHRNQSWEHCRGLVNKFVAIDPILMVVASKSLWENGHTDIQQERLIMWNPPTCTMFQLVQVLVEHLLLSLEGGT